MRPSIVVSLCSVLLAAPAFGQGVDLGSLKRQMKVRADWAERYQESRRGPEVTENFSRSVRIGANGTLDLSNVAGDITITGGGGGDEVRIDAVKRARARDGDAKSLLDELRIEIVESGSRVEVRTIHPRNRRNSSGTVDYTITMPSGASASVRSVSGDVRVTNVRGELRVESVSGDVVTRGATRLALAKSVSGDVEVSDAASEGHVTVSTVSGDVTARGLKARTLELGSVSGDVILTDVTSERAMVKTVSGGIEYSGPLARSGRYEMNAHSGNIRLTVSGTTGFELEATTFSGSVRSDFPMTLRSGNDSPGRRNRSIRGTYGDASAIVTLTSFSGDIVVAKG